MLLNNIKKELENKKMSIYQLAEQMNMTYAACYKLVNRDYLDTSTLGSVVKVANILDLSLMDLFVELEYSEDDFDDDDKLFEIEEGKKAGIDISVYADNKYSAEQMSAIRFALTNKLDVKDILDENLTEQEMINRLWIQQFAPKLDINKPLSEQVKNGYVYRTHGIVGMTEFGYLGDYNYEVGEEMQAKSGYDFEICLTAEDWIERLNDGYDIYKVEILDDAKAKYDWCEMEWHKENVLYCENIKVLEKICTKNMTMLANIQLTI